MRLFSKVLCLCQVLVLLDSCSKAPVPDAVSVPTGERVVSLAPSLTEIVCAVGAGSNLVGRTTACDYPPEAVSNVAVVGGFGAPAFDRLVRVHPTLVLEGDMMDTSFNVLLDRAGIRHASVNCRTLDDIPAAIREVGRLVHQPEKAAALADRLAAEVAALRDERDRRRAAGSKEPTVFAEIWGDPVTTVGRKAFVAELIALAGGRNLTDDVSEKDYFSIAPEWVIARDPDVILCLYPSTAGAIREQVGSRMGWGQLRAVREGRIYGGLDNNLVLRPGPRVVQGIDAIRQCIGP